MANRQKPFTRTKLIFIMMFIVTALIFSGCGAAKPKTDIDDAKYGFTEYFKDNAGSTRYALDKNNSLYSYAINTDPKGNKTLVCNLVAENTGGVKQHSPASTLLILTHNGVLYGDGYWAGNKGFAKILEGVSEYRLDEEGGSFSNILALTKDCVLYGWGQNRLGETGNGGSQYGGTNPEVKTPIRIMDNVKSFDLAKNDKSYYRSAALTNNGDLYVWSFYGRTMSSDFKNSMEHRLFSPVKRLESVKSFELQEKGALASTDQGDILINEEKIRDEKFDKAFGDKKSQDQSASDKPAGTDTSVEGNLVVVFKDKAFEQEIRKILKKPTGDIYKADAAKVGSLTLSTSQISDLGGIENFTGLYRLAVNNTRVRDFSSIGKLTNLESLSLGRNEALTDITFLKKLTKLNDLFIGNSKLDSLAGIEGLASLKTLTLDEIQGSDLSALKGLTNLETLDIQNNSFTDLSALKGLTKLKSLQLCRNGLRDITALKGLTQLDWLDLNSNQLSDITALQGLAKLSYLNVIGNQITEVSPLKALTNLRELGLRENPIADEAAKEALKKALPGCKIYF